MSAALERRRQRIMRELSAGIDEATRVEEEATRAAAEARQTRRAFEHASERIAAVQASPVQIELAESRRIAGPKAIGKVVEVLASVGRTTQAEVTRATALNSGTVTHAMRVLEADAQVRRTGRRHHGSDEWQWIGLTQQSKNGARKATVERGRAAAK